MRLGAPLALGVMERGKGREERGTPLACNGRVGRGTLLACNGRVGSDQRGIPSDQGVSEGNKTVGKGVVTGKVDKVRRGMKGSRTLVEFKSLISSQKLLSLLVSLLVVSPPPLLLFLLQNGGKQ